MLVCIIVLVHSKIASAFFIASWACFSVKNNSLG